MKQCRHHNTYYFQWLAHSDPRIGPGQTEWLVKTFLKNVKEHIYKWPFTYDVRKILGAHCLTNRSISHEGDPPLSGALRLHGVGLVVLPLTYPAD